MKYLWIIYLLLAAQSCIEIVNGSAYEYLTEEQQDKIVKFESTNASLDKNKIYEISGSQLKDLIKSNERSMIYIFTSGCKSEDCVPLSVMENYAQKNNYHLYLVLSDYNKLELTTSQKINSQLYSINADSYNLKNSTKYLRAFKKDLHYYDVSGGEKFVGNILFFKKDSLVEIKKSVEQ